MTDPNAPARYDDEANVEPTAREGEAVPEVETVLPEAAASMANEPAKTGAAAFTLGDTVLLDDPFGELDRDLVRLTRDAALNVASRLKNVDRGVFTYGTTWTPDRHKKLPPGN